MVISHVLEDRTAVREGTRFLEILGCRVGKFFPEQLHHRFIPHGIDDALVGQNGIRIQPGSNKKDTYEKDYYPQTMHDYLREAMQLPNDVFRKQNAGFSPRSAT